VTLNKEQYSYIQEMSSHGASVKEVLEFTRELIESEQFKAKTMVQALRFQSLWILLEDKIDELKEVS
jgi:hypothetical protein